MFTIKGLRNIDSTLIDGKQIQIKLSSV